MAISGKPFPRKTCSGSKYEGPVFTMVREGEKVAPPSCETAKTMPEMSHQTTYSVPSEATAPVNPSTAPLSSRGRPSLVLISMGFDQEIPPSVDRSNSMRDLV